MGGGFHLLSMVFKNFWGVDGGWSFSLDETLNNDYIADNLNKSS